jgi:hypothetical protein
MRGRPKTAHEDAAVDEVLEMHVLEHEAGGERADNRRVDPLLRCDRASDGR